jgi:hypothetical protein
VDLLESVFPAAPELLAWEHYILSKTLIALWKNLFLLALFELLALMASPNTARLFPQ